VFSEEGGVSEAPGASGADSESVGSAANAVSGAIKLAQSSSAVSTETTEPAESPEIRPFLVCLLVPQTAKSDFSQALAILALRLFVCLSMPILSFALISQAAFCL
jgi:hypothetical protein